MSLTKIYTVFCDDADCGRWIGEDLSAQGARRIARRRGWKRITGTVRSGLDYCPNCAPSHPEAK